MISQIYTDKIKHRFTQIIFFASCFLLPASCCAQETVSSIELIENAQSYDGEQVVYEGEVIGEEMHRRDGVWVNLYDGDNSIGVWLSPEMAEIIDYKGGYKARGDILEVRGIFNRACPQHGGDLDIHAISLRKIKPGWQKQKQIIPAKRNLVIILLVVLCLILILRSLISR
jgi:hypothetical protein